MEEDIVEELSESFEGEVSDEPANEETQALRKMFAEMRTEWERHLAGHISLLANAFSGQPNPYYQKTSTKPLVTGKPHHRKRRR